MTFDTDIDDETHFFSSRYDSKQKSITFLAGWPAGRLSPPHYRMTLLKWNNGVVWFFLFLDCYDFPSIIKVRLIEQLISMMQQVSSEKQFRNDFSNQYGMN